MNQSTTLLCEPRPWGCRCRRWGRRRKIEGQPEVPARRPIFIGEFAVSLQVEISLQLVADRKDVANLRADSGHPRPEAADAITGAAVAAEFLIEITHEPHLPLLGQELRRAPVEVHVDAVLILRGGVLEVVGEAEHA